MLNGKYRSIAFIIERLHRNSIIFNKLNVSEYTLAEYIGEALLLIGARPQYQDNFVIIDIKDHRGLLPCEPVQIESIRDCSTGIGYKKSTDTFAGSPSPSSTQNLFLNSNEYIIDGNIIKTDTLKEGQLELKYTSLYTDADGNPMIPDDERYAKAVESYVKYMVYRPLWEIGQIRDAVYRQAEQDWLFYVNSAKTKAHMPNIDGMESLKNQVTKLLKDFNTRNDTGRNLGRPEQRRGYNIK